MPPNVNELEKFGTEFTRCCLVAAFPSGVSLFALVNEATAPVWLIYPGFTIWGCLSGFVFCPQATLETNSVDNASIRTCTPFLKQLYKSLPFEPSTGNTMRPLHTVRYPGQSYMPRRKV